MNLHLRDGPHIQSFFKINVALVPLLTHYSLHANYDGKEEKWAVGKRMAAWSCYQWLQSSLCFYDLVKQTILYHYQWLLRGKLICMPLIQCMALLHSTHIGIQVQVWLNYKNTSQ